MNNSPVSLNLTNFMTNRTIKFRAWVYDENKMFYPGKERNYYINIEGGLFRVGKLSDTKKIITIPETKSKLMQFTGLLDKNGKEIYEGDIIIYSNNKYDPSNGDDPVCTDVVKWDDGMLGWVISSADEYLHWVYDDNDLEVIGNIYENPEPLNSL